MDIQTWLYNLDLVNGISSIPHVMVINDLMLHVVLSHWIFVQSSLIIKVYSISWYCIISSIASLFHIYGAWVHLSVNVCYSIFILTTFFFFLNYFNLFMWEWVESGFGCPDTNDQSKIRNPPSAQQARFTRVTHPISFYMNYKRWIN